MKNTRQHLWAICLGLECSLAFGCNLANPRELTRDKAKSLLIRSGVLQPQTQVAVSESAYKLAEKDGVFKFRVVFGPEGTNPDTYLSQEGRRYFHNYCWMGRLTIVNSPIQIQVIEISGITDARPGEGELAEFKWGYLDAPEFVNKYTGTTGPDKSYYGCASFKLFDDGWRQTDVKWKKCVG